MLARAAGGVSGAFARRSAPSALPHPGKARVNSSTDDRSKPAERPMTLYVCTTCRDADHVVGQGAPCAGARLYANISAAPADPLINIVPVECLSVCTRTCAVGFAAPGKWTYVYGDLPAETATPVVLAGARLYAETADGLIPWKLRPQELKKGVISRVPPMAAE